MKVALVHDYIKEYGGAERVLEALHDIFPNAHVYTSIYLPQYLGPHKERFKDWVIKPSFLQLVPFKGKLISFFRFIGPWVFKSMDLSDYDLVIVSAAGTFTSPNYIKTGKKTTHVCYYHTPPRYLYGYATAAPWKSVWWRKFLYIFGQVPMHFLRMADFSAAQRPDIMIANSEETRARINKFYRRDSIVVYPPVDTKMVNKNREGKKDYFIAGGRLARPKHIDLIIKTCTQNKIPLKVFGKEFAGYGEELRSMAGANIEFLGEITDEEKLKYLGEAKAYIFAAEDEEFGILPVEAMGQGTPVIAYHSGGVKEIVVAGKTGIFFDELSEECLNSALNEFETTDFKDIEVKQRAQMFTKDVFAKEILKLVNKKK